MFLIVRQESWNALAIFCVASFPIGTAHTNWRALIWTEGTCEVVSISKGERLGSQLNHVCTWTPKKKPGTVAKPMWNISWFPGPPLYLKHSALSIHRDYSSYEAALKVVDFSS